MSVRAGGLIRGFVAVVLAVTVSLILAIAGLEIYLRLFSTSSVTPGYVQVHPQRRYALRPSFAGKTYEHPLSINSIGLRDYERSVDTDAFRIVILGDSVTFGIGVRSEDVFAKRLESLLQVKYPGRSIQVFNLGVPSYNTRAEYRYLEEIYPLLKPDLILVEYTAGNDTGLLDPRHGRMQNNPLLLSTFELLDPWRGYFWRLYAYDFLAVRAQRLPNALRRMQSKEEPATVSQAQLINPDLYSDSFLGWQQTKAAFADFATFSAQRDIPLAFLLYINNQQLAANGADDVTAPIRLKVRAALEQSGVKNIMELDETYRHYSGRESELWVNPSDNHFSVVAHQLVSSGLLTYLESSGLLAGLSQSVSKESVIELKR